MHELRRIAAALPIIVSGAVAIRPTREGPSRRPPVRAASAHPHDRQAVPPRRPLAAVGFAHAGGRRDPIGNIQVNGESRTGTVWAGTSVMQARYPVPRRRAECSPSSGAIGPGGRGLCRGAATVRASIFRVGCPTPTGTPWPSLPQVPMPGSRRMSLPTMLTLVSTSGPLPMRVAPFTGRADLAVLDLVGLGAGEHELAGGDVDLAAAEIHGIETVLHRLDDLLGRMRAGQHIGVASCAASAAWAKLSRRPLPVGSMPMRRAFWRSCM